MTPRTLRAWSWLHKWSSLVSTVFLLVLCLTGLPLIARSIERPPGPAKTRLAAAHRRQNCQSSVCHAATSYGGR